jgi:ABC-type multidrug transport system fused ATPase/permease subunit
MRELLRPEVSSIIKTLCIVVVCAVANLFIAVFIQRVLDTALAGDIDAFIQTLLVGVAYLALLFALSALAALSLQKTRNRITNGIRARLMNGTLELPIGQFQKTDSGDHISPFVNDAKIIEENYIDPLFEIAQSIVLFIGSIALMFVYSPPVAIFTIVTVLLMLILPSLIGAPLQKRQDAYSTELGAFTSKLKDIFSGFETIRSYRIGHLIAGDFKTANDALTHSKVRVDRLFAVNESLSLILSAIFQVGVICLSAYLVMIGHISAGALLAIVQLSATVAMPLTIIFTNLPKMQSTKLVAEAIGKRIAAGTAATATTPLRFENAITFDDVSFAYDEQPVLKGVNLNIEKNKKYAIVGDNGSGKSTLAKLMAGYYGGYEGRLLFDGEGVDEGSRAAIPDMTAIIHQNVYLFNATIKDNVCLFAEYPPAELERAAQGSGLEAVINKDGLGYDYPVKENGQNLSGGQRQRIAVARALIRNKPIMILDEGTSAIEQKTGLEIESALLGTRDLTLITITHRLDAANLRNYDSVIVMHDGEIVEQGPFDRLIAGPGHLCAMMDNVR